MTTKKKVAFIFNFVTPYRKTFFEKLCSNQEYEWLVIHGNKQKEDGRPALKGIFTFPNKSVRYIEAKVGPFDLRWQGEIITTLNAWKPDIIITLGIPSIITNWLAMDWAHRHGAKTITWHCGWEAQSGNPYTLPIKRWLTSKYLNLVDHTLAYSTKGANYLIKLQGSTENITICYNGLEIDPLVENEALFISQAKELRQLEHVGEKKVFIYVGGMLADKQVPLLLKAFQALDQKGNCLLWLVGDGPDMPKLKALAESLKLNNVKFWGRIIDGVDAYFAAADYFILPGVGGLALNQALFWELPCIVGEADGTEDDLIIENITGFRFQPGSTESLTTAMKKCLALTDEQKNYFGKAGRQLVVERSNVDEMIKIFISTIEHLLKKNNIGEN